MKHYGPNPWENRAREAEYKVRGLKTRLEDKKNQISRMRGTERRCMAEMMELDSFYIERVRLLHKRIDDLFVKLKEADTINEELVIKQASLQGKIDTLENEKEDEA